MSTLTIVVADYLNSEVALGEAKAVVQTQEAAGSAKPKLPPQLQSSSSVLSTEKSPFFSSGLLDLPDGALLRSAPKLATPLSAFAKQCLSNSKDDSTIRESWISTEKDFKSVSAPMTVMSSLLPVSTFKTSVNKGVAFTETNPGKQSEYFCLDEVKNVIEAARPAWNNSELDTDPILDGATLGAAVASKSADSFTHVGICEMTSDMPSGLSPKISTTVVGTNSPVSLTLTAPPLRKLKLSLKVSSLTKLYSTPQISPKSVRFASHIANVKTFDGRDSPSAVSLQNSPSGSPTYVFSALDNFSVSRNFADLGFSDSEISSDSDLDVYQEYTKDRHYKITRSNFVAPKNIYDKRECPVYLQRATLTSDKKLMALLVMCQNLAFEKKVSVKLTLNNWNSVLIFNNFTYIKLFSSVNYDQFQFVIPFSHLPSSISPQFCIRYDVSNSTYWDNNQEKNYSFSLTAVQELAKDSPAFFKSPETALGMNKKAFNNFTSTFSTYDQFTSGSPKNSGNVPKASSFASGNAVPSTSRNSSGAFLFGTSSCTQYNELVNKLLVAKTESENYLANLAAGPASLTRSLSLQSISKPSIPSAGPISLATGSRYSQSYLSKRLSTKSAVATVEPTKPVAPIVASELQYKPLVSASSEISRAIPGVTKSASSSDFSNTKFNSSSYAALLANYCFNGADDAMISCPMESLIGSHASSSSSVNSDFIGHSLASVRSLSGSFQV